MSLQRDIFLVSAGYTQEIICDIGAMVDDDVAHEQPRSLRICVHDNTYYLTDGKTNTFPTASLGVHLILLHTKMGRR